MPRLAFRQRTFGFRRWQERFFAGVPYDQVMMNGAAPISHELAELAVWFTCDDERNEQKLRALRSQPSQVEGLVGMVGEGTYRELIREEFFRLPDPGDFTT